MKKNTIFLSESTRKFITVSILEFNRLYPNEPLFKNMVVTTDKETKLIVGEYMNEKITKSTIKNSKIKENYIDSLELEYIQKLLLDLEKIAVKFFHDENTRKLFSEKIFEKSNFAKNRNQKDVSIPIPFLTYDFLLYSETVETKKIDNTSDIELIDTKYIIAPRLIPHLITLYTFLAIPNTNGEGVELDNHDSMGYHFHYTVKENKRNKRTKMLLLFDPLSFVPEKKDYTLFAEYHGGDNYLNIDIEKIGTKKRINIHTVCLKIGKKRGIQKFRKLSAESKVFY